MQRAGKAAFSTLLSHWPNTANVICFCGSGNNGGDGYVIAALAADKGINARVIAVGDTNALRGDARLAMDMAREHEVTIIPFTELTEADYQLPITETVLVDAMLGTGLQGDVRGSYLEAVQAGWQLLEGTANELPEWLQ